MSSSAAFSMLSSIDDVLIALHDTKISSSSSFGLKTGALDKVSAMICVFPGVHVVVKLYGIIFSLNL